MARLDARQAHDLNFRELVPIAPVWIEFGYGKKRIDAPAPDVRAACWHVPDPSLAQGTIRGGPDLNSRSLGNGFNRSQIRRGPRGYSLRVSDAVPPLFLPPATRPLDFPQLGHDRSPPWICSLTI
jgi:hypothetical protein